MTVVLSEEDQMDVMKGDFIGIDLFGAGTATIAQVPGGISLPYQNYSTFTVLQLQIIKIQTFLKTVFLEQ